MQNQEQLETLIATIQKSSIVAVDTETNITDTLADRRLVGISVSTDDQDFYIPVGHEGLMVQIMGNYQGELPKDLFYGDFTLLMHNASFDLNVLKDFEFNVNHLIDTMLMHHHIDEYRPHGLKELAKSRLGMDESKELAKSVAGTAKKLGGNEFIPVPLMAEYAKQDTRMTYKLYENLLRDWIPDYRELWTTLDRPFLLFLTKIERRGLLIDRKAATEKLNASRRRLLELRQELDFDPMKPAILESKLFSLPPDGLGLKPSAYGVSRPTMDEAYLASIGHPLTAMVLEYRQLVKMCSAYYEAYLEKSQVDGRLHPNFLQHGTLTGRLSCEKPNLQQIPRDVDTKPIKKLFLPEEGKQLWEFDFSGLEARMAAVYSKDEAMLEVFRNDGDIHQMIADRIGTKRQTAKTTVFLVLYGGGVGKLSEQLNCTQTQARKILTQMRSEFPRIFETANRATTIAQERGWVKYWSKRRRHFKESYEAHKAFNSVIQGGSADLCKRAILNLDEAGYDITNTVHDSVWVEIPVNEVETSLKEIPRLMTEWTTDTFGINFPVEGKRLN